MHEVCEVLRNGREPSPGGKGWDRLFPTPSYYFLMSSISNSGITLSLKHLGLLMVEYTGQCWVFVFLLVEALGLYVYENK